MLSFVSTLWFNCIAKYIQSECINKKNIMLISMWSSGLWFKRAILQCVMMWCNIYKYLFFFLFFANHIRYDQRVNGGWERDIEIECEWMCAYIRVHLLAHSYWLNGHLCVRTSSTKMNDSMNNAYANEQQQ